MDHRIVLLGASGFLGSYLQKKWNKASNTEVIALSTKDIDLAVPDSVKLLSTLLSTDTTLVILSAIKKELGDSIELYSKNIEIIKNIIAATKISPVNKIVFMSSCAVYGEDISHKIISESTLPKIRTFYGLAKYTSEKLLSLSSDIDQLIIRIPLVYGNHPRSDNYGPAGFFRKILADEPITLWGDALEKREFLYIQDFVDILDQLISNSSNGIYNIASGTSYSFKEVINNIESLTKKKSTLIKQERTKPFVDHHFDNGKLTQIIGKFPFTTLEQGLSKFLN
jgi:UDP-glucose 4-epimerase